MNSGKRQQGLLGEVLTHRRPLGVSFVLIFIFTVVTLNAFGLVPEMPEKESAEVITERAKNDTQSVRAAGISRPASEGFYEDKRVSPVRVVVPSVGIDARVITPSSKDVAVLDSALLKGAVHYPGSGVLSDTSNLFIFGHSSHLPVVNNKNFQAFNDLEKTKPGDLVRVESSDVANIYEVTSVEMVKASEALIELGGSSKMLTLSTCNSFGKPTDRYVVKAQFVKVEAL